MAISIIQNLPSVASAYADNLFIVATDNPNVQLIKHELVINTVVVSTQFSPVYEGEAELHLGPTYRSALGSYNNPLDNLGEDFYNVDTNNHNLLVTDRLTEVINPVTKDFGVIGDYPRRILKSVITPPVSPMSPAMFCNEVNTNHNMIIRWAFDDQKVPIMVRTHTQTNYEIDQISVEDGSEEPFGEVVVNQRMGQGMKRLTGPHKGYDLVIDGGNSQPMRIYLDHKCYQRSKTIYWLNSLGGWDWFNAIDYEIIHKSEKLQGIRYGHRGREKDIMQLSMGNTKEYKLFGRALNSEFYYYLKDMVSSPIAFDEDGNRIRILDTNVDIEREGMILEPEIRIEYIKENSISY